MYVTSGIGFKIKARFRCPPEVPIFTLRREGGSD
jgi:predicted MPP superfamily phosphohydrolase